MKILGIESSCDETAASLIEGKRGQIKVISNVVSSQIELHKKYGGVIPELAAREHVTEILPVIDSALKTNGITPKNFSKKINAIAVAGGPGLISSLLVGIETAKTFSYVFDVPLISVNHIEGHVYANFIENKNISFPAIVLTVSGGHTMLILMRDYNNFETLGETRDDAAGEAFDKSAQLMELGYPGGPIISNYAEQAQNQDLVEKLPRPMMNSNNLDFSFSGLKTALLYQLQKDKKYKNKIPEYCQEFQQAVIDVLIKKTIKAAKEHRAKNIMLSGGVSANKELRKQMQTAVKKDLSAVNFFKPQISFTTDNAAMIAAAGYFKAREKKYINWREIKANPNQAL